MFGSDKYTPVELQGASHINADGIRTSKRKRVANVRVLTDLEPSEEEKNWGKGRGRRAKGAQPGTDSPLH